YQKLRTDRVEEKHDQNQDKKPKAPEIKEEVLQNANFMEQFVPIAPEEEKRVERTTPENNVKTVEPTISSAEQQALEKEVFLNYKTGHRHTVKAKIADENYPLSAQNEQNDTLLHLVAEKNDIKLANFIQRQSMRMEQNQKWEALLKMQNAQGETPL